MWRSDKAAEYLGVNRKTLRDWSQKGKIPCYRDPGGCYWYDPEEIESWFEQLRVEVPEPNLQPTERRRGSDLRKRAEKAKRSLAERHGIIY